MQVPSSLLTLSGERWTAEIPFCLGGPFLLYNNNVSITEDIYPVRRDIDDHIDDLDDLGIV